MVILSCQLGFPGARWRWICHWIQEAQSKLPLLTFIAEPAEPGETKTTHRRKYLCKVDSRIENKSAHVYTYTYNEIMISWYHDTMISWYNDIIPYIIPYICLTCIINLSSFQHVCHCQKRIKTRYLGYGHPIMGILTMGIDKNPWIDNHLSDMGKLPKSSQWYSYLVESCVAYLCLSHLDWFCLDQISVVN